jgi:hypothetical protein
MGDSIVPKDFQPACLDVDANGELTCLGIPLVQYQPADLLTIRGRALEIAAQVAAFAKAAEYAIEQTMIADGSTEIYHPDYVVVRESSAIAPSKNEKALYEGFTALARDGVLDPRAVEAAVGKEEVTVYSAHLGKLKPLLKNGAAQRVFSACTTPGGRTPLKLKITAKAEPRRWGRGTSG